MERGVTIEDFEESHPRIGSIFIYQGWTHMLTNAVKVSPTLVREFYANMYGLQDSVFQTMLRGVLIRVTLDLIREIMDTPEVT